MSIRKRQDENPKDHHSRANNVLLFPSSRGIKQNKPHQQFINDDENELHNSLIEKSDQNNLQHEKHEKTNLKGDYANIAILFFLYMLQGIPLGLTAAIPMLLQNRGASYKQQAEFSFAFWPFNLKLFWAPIVDSLHWKKFGRRKSWLIPTQYLIGIFMLFLSTHVNGWLGDATGTSGDGSGTGGVQNLQALTMIFFFLNFLAATQDIAVDGWALTMLKRCNVGHASTCNSVGQTAGYFFGYVAFIALESKDFCNSYLRFEPQNEGLVTLPQFLWFWGICFLIITTLVGVLKRETDNNSSSLSSSEKQRYNDQLELDIKQSYAVLLDIIKLRPIQILTGILLTVKVTFAACDTVSSLKLIDAGVPKEKLALLAVPIIPLQIILPLVISKYTSGPKPMNVYLKAIPYRIVFSIFAVALVYITPSLIKNGQVPTYYYVILILNYGIYQIFLYCMFVAIMAFFAKISDPAVGGTYMTLLNTLTNMGTNWPNTFVLWLVDILTWRECLHPEVNASNTCANKTEREECAAAGGQCETIIDGYYVEAIFCLIYGIIWLYFCKSQILKLQNLPIRKWHVISDGRKGS